MEENSKIATGQEDEYITGCLLGYSYFRKILSDDNGLWSYKKIKKR